MSCLPCFFCVCSLLPCGHLPGKDWPPGSCLWLWFCHFPMWYPVSGVVLDCINSWYVQSFLLCNLTLIIFDLLTSSQGHPFDPRVNILLASSSSHHPGRFDMTHNHGGKDLFGLQCNPTAPSPTPEAWPRNQNKSKTKLQSMVHHRRYLLFVHPKYLHTDRLFMQFCRLAFSFRLTLHVLPTFVVGLCGYMQHP